MRLIKKYNLEYWIGKKKIQTICYNMTKGFCSGEKTKCINSERFDTGKFKLKEVKK